MRRSLCIIAMLAVGPGAVAAAQSAAADDPVLREGFYAFRMADVLRLNCPSISSNFVTGHRVWNSLYAHGAAQGYAKSDVDAVRDSLEGTVASDLTARGATPGATAGYCKIAREEIARRTDVGKLLKAN